MPLASFTFLHAADIHLDSPLLGLSRYEGVPAEEIRRAPRAAFDRLIGTAIDRHVDFVIIAGDLYDGDWKDMRTGLYFAGAVGRLARAGIAVFLLAGNHDAASVLTKELPASANLHRFSTARPQTHRLDHLGVVLHGRSFEGRAVTENLAATYPAAVPGAFNIGVLHTSLSGDAAHETYAPCTQAELAAKGYDYWALGHVHARQVVCEHPHIVFPGILQGRSMRETGPHGAMLVHVTDGEVSALEPLTLDLVRWGSARVDAGGITDMAALHGRIGDVLRRTREDAAADMALIVRVTIGGATALHGALQDVSLRLRDEIRAIAAEISADLWIEKIVIGTQAPAHGPQPEDMGDIAALIPEPDAALARMLRDDMEKFLAALPEMETDTLLRGARAGDWTQIMSAAATGLRHRLTTGE